MRFQLQWDRLKDVLIAIPALHLFVCFFYLFFFEASFGGGVEDFSSPRDAFAISISKIAIVYFAAFIVLLIIILFNAGVRIERTRERALKRSGQGSKLSTLMLLIGGLVLLLASAAVPAAMFVMYYIRTGFFAFNLLFFPTAVIVSGVIAVLILRYDIARRWVPVISLVVSLFLSVGIQGMSDGQEARARTFEELAAKRARCGDFVVLLPAGDLFLAVGRDNSRALIDGDCRPKFTLYDRRQFKQFVEFSISDPFALNAQRRTAPKT